MHGKLVPFENRPLQEKTMNVSTISIITSAGALVTGLVGLAAARKRHEEISGRIAARERCESVEGIAHSVRALLQEEEDAAARGVRVTVATSAVATATAEVVAALATNDANALHNANWKLEVAQTTLRLLKA